MLPVLGSRVTLPLLATVLLVLLNSTPTSATPVAVAAAAGLSPLDSWNKAASRPRPMHTYPDTGSIFNPYGNHDRLAQSQGRIQQSTPIAILNTFQKEKQFPVLCVPNKKMRSCNINCVPSGNQGSKTEDNYRCVVGFCGGKHLTAEQGARCADDHTKYDFAF